MSFFKRIFRFKNLLKAAALAAGIYTGGAALGAFGAGTAAGAAGAAGTATKAGMFARSLAAAGKVAKGFQTAASVAQGVNAVRSVLPTGGSKNAGSLEQAAQFKAMRPDLMSLPTSLADISGQDQVQQRTSLATKGLEQGLSSEEEAYYNNLAQRTLIGEGNTVGDINSLTPIEQQYYRRKGYNVEDPNELLRSLQQG